VLAFAKEWKKVSLELHECWPPRAWLKTSCSTSWITLSHCEMHDLTMMNDDDMIRRRSKRYSSMVLVKEEPSYLDLGT
jgi:hypothetical protein